MLLRTIFAGLRSLCSVRNAHSPHCVTAVACPPHMSPYKRDLPQGSPPAPRFCVSGQTKNVAAHHFCRAPFLVLRAQCALTALRHSSRLSAAHVAVQAGFAAGVSPCTPFLCLRPDEKCCCAPFLPDSVPCAPCAMCTHRTASQNIFLCYVRCAYLFVQQIGAAFSCDLQRLFRAPGVHLLMVARDQYVGDG